MSNPTERHGALLTYCADHHCKGCPMNDPLLGCIDDEDECVVALATVALEPDLGVAP